MNKKLYWLALLFILIVATPLLAVKPSPQLSGLTNNQLSILYPKNEFFIRGSNLTLHFHVHNASGSVLSNSTTDCLIHVYDYKNSHIVQQKMIFDGFDFEAKLYQNASNRSGLYPIEVYCNNSAGYYGFLSSFYEITIDGYAKDDAAGIPLIVVLVLVPLIFGFFLLYSAFNLSDEHDILKIGLYLVSFFTFVSSFNFGMVGVVKFFDMPELQGVITTTNFVMIILFIIILFYFIIFGIKTMLANLVDKKKKRLEY